MTSKISLKPAGGKPGRPRKPAGAPTMGLSERVREGVKLMVEEGLQRKEVCQRIGMSYRKFCEAMRNPVVLKHYREQVKAMRDAEEARNVTVAIELRERGVRAGATAAHGRVALDAIRYIDGDQPGRAPLVNINITPGYVMDLTDRPRPVIDVTPEIIRVDDLASPQDEAW